ncbi:coiled-coil domain-containing protein 24 isoform X1 [Anarrhichthys ocellatus]|uniref:coiled-coil domain-containing protein 24 isoform X1 n=1 Tax=Anarrhichthys ocellatus TaxID=433405 RepID=UPI0012EE0BC8|nr:coiled-coil domain-containing protein 24 isoform X1 [Anarrhichthys ocellatus]
MQSLDGTQLWSPGQSLWSLITEHVPGSDLPKIHTALGSSLVDVYSEVHTEAEMWHKMWQESQQGNSSSSRAGTPLPRQRASPLADPPAVKELVRAEVKMLLQTLRERVSREGRVAEELLFRYKPETVDYALSHLDSCYRNCTNPGDTDNGSRPSSRCSIQSTAEDEIEAMRDKLNVSDIDQVVDHLRSFLMEECEALNRLVKHFKGNIKQKWPDEVDKSEPSLAELRELRGDIQMDLQLYPSSLAASPTASSPFPLKELKNRFKLSAGQKVSNETLRALSSTSAFRPHPPPPLSHPKPRPPPTAPPSKASASAKVINSSSLSRIHGQHRSTSASTEPRKTQAPICNRITTSVLANRHFTTSLTGPDSDTMTVKTVHCCSFSPEYDSPALRCRTPTSYPSFQVKTPRNSPIHETHLSSHRSIRGSSRECDLSQMERAGSPLWRSRNVNTVPAFPHCDAGSYSSNRMDHSVSKAGKSKTQNGRQNGTCGSSLVSTTVQTDHDRSKSSSESFQSETRSSPAQTGSRESVTGIDRNKNGHLGKEVTRQQSLVGTCTHPAPVMINRQFFTSTKRPLESITSQAKGVQETELELISKLYQPVPPARVST